MTNPIPAIKQFVQQRPALNAVVQAPMQRGKAVGTGMEAIRQSNQGAEDALWGIKPGLAPEELKIRQVQQQLGHLGMGSMMTADASWAVNPTIAAKMAAIKRPVVDPTNFQQANELRQGWQQGDKARFDAALLTKDADTLKEMLPRVPTAYLQGGYGQQVYQLLLNNLQAQFQAAPNPMAKVIAGMSRSIPK